MALSLTQRLQEQKKKTDLAPSRENDPLPDFVENNRSDLTAALSNGEPPLAKRVGKLVQQLAVCPRTREPELLLTLADYMSEALEMEHAQVGTSWRQVKTDKFDLPLLGDMLKVMADRLNDYAPNVLASLIAGKSKRLQTLSDGADKRTVMHIISAAAWVIAEQQYRESTTTATKTKRKKRMSESEIMLLGMNSALAAGGASASDNPFGDIFDTEVFVDGGTQREEVTSGLKTPRIETAAATDDEDDDFGELTVSLSENKFRSKPPESLLRATAEDVIAAGHANFDDLGDDDEDGEDPFDDLD